MINTLQERINLSLEAGNHIKEKFLEAKEINDYQLSINKLREIKPSSLDEINDLLKELFRVEQKNTSGEFTTLMREVLPIKARYGVLYSWIKYSLELYQKNHRKTLLHYIKIIEDIIIFLNKLQGGE